MDRTTPPQGPYQRPLSLTVLDLEKDTNVRSPAVNMLADYRLLHKHGGTSAELRDSSLTVFGGWRDKDSPPSDLSKPRSVWISTLDEIGYLAIHVVLNTSHRDLLVFDEQVAGTRITVVGHPDTSGVGHDAFADLANERSVDVSVNNDTAAEPPIKIR